MNWLSNIFLSHSAVQAVIIICLICALGLALGKVRVRGISLGITYVFFAGILAGALGNYFLPGTPLIDSQMLDYAESFGLVLFVYTLGLQVGPSFFSAFKKGGTRLNLLSTYVVAIGTLIALAVVLFTKFPFPDMMGVLSGATTNTPALGAAQQALKQLGMAQNASTAALATAVTYPLGMVGVIFALMLMKRYLVRIEPKHTGEADPDDAFIASFEISNPAVFGTSLHDIHELDNSKFTITRLWRAGKAELPNGETRLQEGDRILVITPKKCMQHLTILFGRRDDRDWNKEDIDWNKIDRQLMSERIVVTNPKINGKHLRQLHLRNRYGVTVSRVRRAGLTLVATPDLILFMGDRITLVGDAESIQRASNELGNRVKNLDEPNMVTIFLGIVLGLALGALPIFVPGMSYPVRLGLAGGPIVMGILVGAFGPRVHMVAYTTSSANLMLRSLGLSMYLGCLGLDAGAQFLDTVMQPAALGWIGYALLITFLPVMIISFIAVKFYKRSYATAAGMVCGAMANPIALNYVNETTADDKASVAYATVYPLGMFARVIIAQVMVLLWYS